MLAGITGSASGGMSIALQTLGAQYLEICGLTHRQSYLDIFVVAVLVPLVALAVVVTLGTWLGAF